MTEKTARIYLRVTEEEKKEIENLADSVALNVSAYMLKTALNVTIKSRFDRAALGKLYQVNADLARLGNLLKMALDSFYECSDKETIKNINALLDEINGRQLQIKEIALELI